MAQAARDLDVLENVVRMWVRDIAADPQQAFPGKGLMKPDSKRLIGLAGMGRGAGLVLTPGRQLVDARQRDLAAGCRRAADGRVAPR